MKNRTIYSKYSSYIFLFCICIYSSLTSYSSCHLIQLDNSNMEQTLKDHEFVFINFYADWCHFSQMLTPIFEETATAVAEMLDSKRIVLARVNCEVEVEIAQRYRVSKYPTMKLIRWGQPLKAEYRGQRSKDAFIEFLKNNMEDKMTVLDASNETSYVFNEDKRYIVGRFPSRSGPEYDEFAKVGAQLAKDCTFVFIAGNSPPEGPITFKDRTEPPQFYIANVSSSLSIWATSKCVPIVRTLTFENAEELTEEGLPFLILFHHPSDTETPKLFEATVKRELLDERGNVNFLVADGQKFSHPLHHLGKSEQDLPIICIDSFKHMYTLPGDTKTSLEENGKLKTFITDLHSGKLHREFHYGPDPVVHQIDSGSPPSGEAQTGDKDPSSTTPPSSIFKKLAPSRTRYSLLKDEL